MRRLIVALVLAGLLALATAAPVFALTIGVDNDAVTGGGELSGTGCIEGTGEVHSPNPAGVGHSSGPHEVSTPTCPD